MAEAVFIGIAIGVIVPVVLLLGPYLPYLLPRREHLPEPEANRFTEGLLAGLGLRAEDRSEEDEDGLDAYPGN